MSNFDEMSTDELWDALPTSEGFEKGQLLMHLMGRSTEKHEHESALTFVQQAAEVFKEGGFTRDYAYAKAYEGDCLGDIDKHDVAIQCYTEAVSNLDTIDDTLTLASINLHLGDAERKLREFPNAIEHYQLSYELYADQEDFENAAGAHLRLVRVQENHLSGQPMLDLVHKNYEIAKKSESTNLLMEALQSLAFAQSNNEDFTGAIDSAKEAIQMGKLCECSNCVPDCEYVLGVMYCRAGKASKALKYLNSSRTYFLSKKRASMVCLTDAFIGKALSSSDPKGAKKQLKEVLATTNHIEANYARILAGYFLGELFEKLEKPKKAQNSYELVFPIALELFYDRMATKIGLNLSALLLNKGEIDDARTVMTRIESIFVGRPDEESRLLYIKQKLDSPEEL